MAIKPYFAICNAPIGGEIIGYARPQASVTGTGLFLEPASANLSALDNPVIAPNETDVWDAMPVQWRKAYDRQGARFWFVSKPASDSVYFDTVPAHDLPSMELRKRDGSRLSWLYAKPVRIPEWHASERIAFNPVIRGYRFADYFVSKGDGSDGPGWFIFGRNSEKYGTLPDGKGAYVAKVCQPIGPRRYHPHWNGPVSYGFRTMREAQRIADMLNGSN